MIEIDIPGRRKYNISNIVFDYNGTLAVDGKMSKITLDNINKLSKLVEIYILTADTYGDVKNYCEGLPVNLKTFPGNSAASHKKEIVASLTGESICIGNGFNDIEMFKISDLSICILGEEGCCSKTIVQSDIVAKSINDVFDMLFNKNRIRATLRA